MAGGALVLTGGSAIVVAGAGYAIYAAFDYYDEILDRERIRLTLKDLAGRRHFGHAGAGGNRIQSQMVVMPK